MSAARRTPTQHSFCRRLHYWVRARLLRRRILKLSREVNYLRDCLSADKHALQHRQRQGLDVTVPLSRMREEGARLRDLTYQLARANTDLQHVEGLS